MKTSVVAVVVAFVDAVIVGVDHSQSVVAVVVDVVVAVVVDDVVVAVVAVVAD